MYKYLHIANDVKEMMVMLKSLPACSLVFDKNGNLIDANKPALQLLRIDNLQEFNGIQNDVFTIPNYINRTIPELKKGNTVRSKVLLNFTNSGYTIVELYGCMINGCLDVFLFQLFEISLSVNMDLGTFSCYTNIDNSQDCSISESARLVTNDNEVLVLPKSNISRERRSQCLTENNSIQARKIKYRELTNFEITVSKLLSLNMSVLQIANATNKNKRAILLVIRRLNEKLRLNSHQLKNAKLIEFSHVLTAVK